MHVAPCKHSPLEWELHQDLAAYDLVEFHHVVNIASSPVPVFCGYNKVEVSKENPKIVRLYIKVFKPVYKISSALPRARTIDVSEIKGVLRFGRGEGKG
jgi:hypothetical protein